MAGRILIVGNDEDLIAIVRHHLVTQGHEVLHTLDGTEGPVIAMRELPDLVISDTCMSDCDGFAQAAELRLESSLHALPIILLTKAGDPGVLARADRFGVKHCLPKPVARDALLAAVASSLRQRTGCGASL